MYNVGLDNKINNSKVAFKGGIMTYDRILFKDTGKISKKSARLLACLNQLIEKNWAEIKSGELMAECPNYTYRDKNNYISMKPIYTQKFPALLIEHSSKENYNQKILLDRANPNHFLYEKVVATDHGSATLRSYNSLLENNRDIDNAVNNILEKSLKNIIPNETLRIDFADSEFMISERGMVLK